MKHLNFLFSLVISFSVFLISCEKDELPKPIGWFTMDKTSSNINDTISFTNQSLLADEYEWDFGDGGTSSEVNPKYAYEAEGSYEVVLIAKGARGNDIASQVIIIEDYPPVSSFKWTPLLPGIGDTVFFENTSENATNYLWNFGDGNTSGKMNPFHIYSQSGSFKVTLTANDKNNSDIVEKEITITSIPTNIFPGVGARDFKINDTWNDVKDKINFSYGILNSFYELNNKPVHVVYDFENEISFHFMSANGESTLLVDDTLYSIWLKENFIGKTKEGITIGSSLTDVEAIYGQSDWVQDYEYYYYNNLGITFRINDSSKVSSIEIAASSY